MDIFHYHPDTGEYLGVSEALPDPLEEGRFLVPAFATDIEPPAASEHEVSVFEDGAWSVKPDYRGTEYWLSHDERHVITEIGETVPDGASLTRPDPEPAPPVVPSAVTRRQGRLALLEVGKLDDVEAAIEAITDPVQRRAALIEYEADTWERGNAFLQAMWAQLGGTEQQLDDLFILAASK